ncbi:MAG: hypothetical protein ACK5NT_15455, partial [Pyrinomonadaceae bacterium]
TPFTAVLPDIATDNLFPPAQPSRAMVKYMKLTDRQDLSHADMANPRELNEIIWYSVKRDSMPMPPAVSAAEFEALRIGIKPETDDEDGDD